MAKKVIQTTLEERYYDKMEVIRKHYGLPENRYFNIVIQKAIDLLYEKVDETIKIIGEEQIKEIPVAEIELVKEVAERTKASQRKLVKIVEDRNKYVPIATKVVRGDEEYDKLQEEDWNWPKPNQTERL